MLARTYSGVPIAAYAEPIAILRATKLSQTLVPTTHIGLEIGSNAVVGTGHAALAKFVWTPTLSAVFISNGSPIGRGAFHRVHAARTAGKGE